MAKMHSKNQHLVDERALREKKAISNDSPGGQSMDPKRDDMHNLNDSKPKFRGIRVHDKGPDSWGLNKTQRYEE